MGLKATILCERPLVQFSPGRFLLSSVALKLATAKFSFLCCWRDGFRLIHPEKHCEFQPPERLLPMESRAHQKPRLRLCRCHTPGIGNHVDSNCSTKAFHAG